MIKRSKFEGCSKRVPVGVKEQQTQTERHFGAIIKKSECHMTLIRVEPRV